MLFVGWILFCTWHCSSHTWELYSIMRCHLLSSPSCGSYLDSHSLRLLSSQVQFSFLLMVLLIVDICVEKLYLIVILYSLIENVLSDRLVRFCKKIVILRSTSFSQRGNAKTLWKFCTLYCHNLFIFLNNFLYTQNCESKFFSGQDDKSSLFVYYFCENMKQWYF